MVIMNGSKRKRGTALASFFLAGVSWSAAALGQASAPPPADELAQEGGAVAQEAVQEPSDEIVVTARQRSESLIRVPVAVTAVTEAELQRSGATDLVRIAQLAPQVSIARSASGGGASFVIRGIGSQPQEPNLDQTVAINLDGLLINRGRIAQLGMFDLQQVEVLKGPQALFFGKNSPAGVISITSVDPGRQREGYIRAGYEFVARERFVEGAISEPLSDTLRTRLAIRAGEMDGWITNRAMPLPAPYAPAFTLPGRWSKRVPGGIDVAGRLTVEYEPTADFEAELKLFVAHHEDNDFAGGQQLRCIAPTTVPTARGFVDPTGDCKFDRFMSKTAIPEAFRVGMPLARAEAYTNIDAVLGGLTLNYDLTDTLSATSISGLTRLRSKGFAEYTATSVSQIWSGGREETDNFSQELRLISSWDSPINFTLGAYYEHSSRFTEAPQFILFRGPDPATGYYYTSTRLANNKSDSYSAFGQLRWKPIEQIEIAGGARVTREEKNTRIFNSYVHAAALAGLARPGVILDLDYSDSDWSPEATITWYPNSNSTLYAAYKTGYKSGGFANPSTLSRIYENNPSLLELRNEAAEGGEIGYKAQMFDRRLRVEGTLYSYEFTDLQVSSYDVTTATFQIRNAAKARTRGAELSLNLRTGAGLSLFAAGGYNRARYLQFPGAPCFLGQTAAEGCVPTRQPDGRLVNQQDLSGRILHRAPKWGINLGSVYETAVGAGLTLGLNADASYTSSYFGQENLAPASLQDSFWRLNAGARISSDAGWELALIGRNLTNEYYITQGADQPLGTKGSTTVVGPRPREVLIQGTFRF